MFNYSNQVISKLKILFFPKSWIFCHFGSVFKGFTLK